MERQISDSSWRTLLYNLESLLRPREIESIEENLTMEPESVQRKVEQDALEAARQHPLYLVHVFRWYVLPRPPEEDIKGREKYEAYVKDFDQRICNRWVEQLDHEIPAQQEEGLGCLKLSGVDGYWIGEEYLKISKKAPFKECEVTVVRVVRNDEGLSTVMEVKWKAESWWLKIGPTKTLRHEALSDPEQRTADMWERYFQVERDMLARVLLGSPLAFAVSIESSQRPAMLVKDAGDSLQLSLRVLTPGDVYEMSQQLYKVLKASGKRGVIHGDVCLDNICHKNGVYSLIDWGLSCGRPLYQLVHAVDKTWPGLPMDKPGIPNWETSPDCCFRGLRPYDTVHDLESLAYCCMKILGGGKSLPWASDVNVEMSEKEVLKARQNFSNHLLNELHIYKPLLRKLTMMTNIVTQQRKRPKTSPEKSRPK